MHVPHVKVSAGENAFGRATFVSDAIGNAIEPMNGHLNKEVAISRGQMGTLTEQMANLVTNVARIQFTIEKNDLISTFPWRKPGSLSKSPLQRPSFPALPTSTWLQRVIFWLISPSRSRSIPINMPATSSLSLSNPTGDVGQILGAYHPKWIHNPRANDGGLKT